MAEEDTASSEGEGWLAMVKRLACTVPYREWGEPSGCYTSVMSSGRSTRIDPIPRGGHKISSYPVRRICGEASCVTVLSRYNGATFCWVHESPTFSGAALRR
jgi:hypothetical protein